MTGHGVAYWLVIGVVYGALSYCTVDLLRSRVQAWRMRRSFVRVRALDHIPTDVTFPRCLPGDPSPRRRRAS